MNLAFTEEQEELRAMARAFLADHSSAEQVRQVMTTERGYAPDVWKRVGAELGWPAITIPEAYGGLGLGYVELVALLEETGRALFCSPFFSTVCLAANAILELGTEAQKEALLPGIAEGETTATLAFSEAGGRWDASGIGLLATPEGDGFRLSGTKTFVPDGHTVDRIVVVARAPGSSGEEGLGLFVVEADSEGLRRRFLPTMDQTRRQAELCFDGVVLPGSARLGEAVAPWPAIQRVLDLAAVAVAAEQVGGAQQCLDLAVAYAKQREQFGRVIGSFQAIKHKCADMAVLVESARSAAYHAGWVAASDPGELALAASTAKAYASDAFWHCAAENLQIHGGVGFTWEYDVHLYLKRARSTEAFLGTPAHHRERLAGLIGL